jgi:hypothetical protein
MTKASASQIHTLHMHQCLFMINTNFSLQFEQQESSFPILPILHSENTTFTIESPRVCQLC